MRGGLGGGELADVGDEAHESRGSRGDPRSQVTRAAWRLQARKGTATWRGTRAGLERHEDEHGEDESIRFPSGTGAKR